MTIKIIGSLGLALIIMGCATAPDKIAPTYVSGLQYQSLDCEQIGEETRLVEGALATASEAQKKARSNDTIGVIFLGLPVSSLSGSNQASHIANLKGQLAALGKINVVKKCFKMPDPEPITEKTKIDPTEESPAEKNAD